MPWLPLFISQDDLKLISDWLAEEEDISLISSIGEGEWKASPDFEIKTSGRYCLYHKNSGDLPLLAETMDGEDSIIPNPFKGWKERRAGANPNMPYFGAEIPSIFWFNVRLEKNNEIGMSSFEWIGNHYSIIGSPAPDIAMKWWNRLRRWTKKNADRIPRSGLIREGKPEIWTFENALREIESGKSRALNP